MNFTYTVRKPPDFKYGNQNSDGSFNGMIGELEKHNADMGILFIPPSRLNKFKYFKPVSKLQIITEYAADQHDQAS